MNEAVFMKKIYASYSLDEEIKCSLLCKATFLLNQDKQVALSHVLHDEVDVLMILKVGIHAHNVDMLEFLMNLDFTS